MAGRERKILKAALRRGYEMLAELESVVAGGKPAANETLARALRVLLEGQIALLEAAAALESPVAEETSGAAETSPQSPGSARSANPIAGRGVQSERAPDASSGPSQPRRVDAATARRALEVFELADLNRWIASGTVFQIRGDLAFLNMDSMGGGKVEEMRGHIVRMGFTNELGILEAEGVTGSILVLLKP